MEPTQVALPISLDVEVPPLASSLEMQVSGDASIMMSCEPKEPLGGIAVPQGPTSCTLLDEFLSSFICIAPHSLLQVPILAWSEWGSTSCFKRHGGRLDKRNK